MKKSSFTRERILSFPITSLFLIKLAKKTLQVSLNEFCDSSNLPSVTKQAFSKARKNISPVTFKLLNCKLLEEYYTDNLYLTWKGYRLVGVDGSDIQIPQTNGLKHEFGMARNHLGDTLGMGKISYAFDVLNKITLDADIGYCKACERSLAVKHVEAIKLLNHDKTKDLYICDRGYPSYWLLYFFYHQHVDFLIRCSISSIFTEVKKIFDEGKDDKVIRLHANQLKWEQIQEIKKRIPNFNPATAYIDVRVVVVLLSTGEKELLITSLLDGKKYTNDDLKYVYNKRWGSEENYLWP